MFLNVFWDVEPPTRREIYKRNKNSEQTGSGSDFAHILTTKNWSDG
jgi:hypothetical protein